MTTPHEPTRNPLTVQPGGNHYKRLEFQPIEFAMANSLDPCTFSLLRYLTRIGNEGKGQDTLDLEKCLHYIKLREHFRVPPRPEGLRVPMARFSSQPGLTAESRYLLNLLGSAIIQPSKLHILRKAIEEALATPQPEPKPKPQPKAKAPAKPAAKPKAKPDASLND